MLAAPRGAVPVGEAVGLALAARPWGWAVLRAVASRGQSCPGKGLGQPGHC